jgi:HD-GYP domain-containing protein (c-di-GMP phosphodiesterase class II)
LWLEDERSGEFRCVSHTGFVGDPESEPLIRLSLSSPVGKHFLSDHTKPFIMSADEVAAAFPVPPGARTRDLAVAPVDPGNELKGWIGARRPAGKDGHFTEERMLLLAGLSSHASTAMQKALLYREQKESADIASSLLDFSRQLAAAEGATEVFEKIVELSARILGSPSATIWLEDSLTREMKAEAAWGFSGSLQRKVFQARFPKEVAVAFLGIAEPYVMDYELIEQIEGAAELADVGSPVALAPLRLEGGRLGCVIVSAPALGDYEFSERKMRLLQGVADQAQLAINNALGFDSLEQTFLDTVEALANALEAKDEYTSHHARWITDAALEVGRELRMDEKALKHLELGALFHDIGKIGIPSDVLLKPGPLDDHEWQIIRMHPELGERILAPIARLAAVRPIVRACHEHFDGSGYPDGRKGDEIPLQSRIILVVDAYHAMTTDRPYRGRLSVSEAFRRLEESRGVQFDPIVVDAFLSVVARNSGFAMTV